MTGTTRITVEGILFDMDGTLVDSTPAVEKALGDWAIQQDMTPDQFFAHSHGVRTQDNVRRFQKYPKLGSQLTPEELSHTVNHLEAQIALCGKLLAEKGERGIVQLPGARKLLDDLIRTGVRWGVVTSATATYADSALVTGKIIPPALPIRITANDCVHGKPHPEPYLNGINALSALPGSSIHPSRILVVEDASSGLKAGIAAGCITLGVATGALGVQGIKDCQDASYKVFNLENVTVVSGDAQSVVLELELLD